MEDENPQHVCLRTQCGICGRAILPGVRFVPLLSSDVFPGSVTCLDRAKFPLEGVLDLRLGDKLLCWRLSCWRCNESPEAAGIHADCFDLFRNECKVDNALDRLWTVVVTRIPWRGAPNLHLDEDSNLAVDLVYEKATMYGIPRLQLLPPELMPMIREHSWSATFWRYICVLSFSRELSAAFINPNESPPMTAVPLSSISRWERGGVPVLSDSPGQPVIRMTIDCRGVRQVEKLPKRPPFQQRRSSNMAFVVEEGSQLTQAVTRCKDGFLLLKLLGYLRGFHIWDMPNPPCLDDCAFSGRTADATRFRTIELSGARGLTFFYSFHKLYAIHAHTPTMPYAKKTFERIPKADACWVYLPIPDGEEIIAIGVQLRRRFARLSTQKPCILVRTKLAGDISIGPYIPGTGQGTAHDIVLSKSPPELLIYNTVDRGPATAFGVYPRERSNDAFVPFHPMRSDHIGYIDRSHFSSAPLKDVTRIQVFNDRETGLCRAILFDYGNGAQRAVGNCRLGVDPRQTFLNPSRICYLELGRPSPALDHEYWALRVDSGCDATHNHEEADWICSPMEGNLEFLASEVESAIRIVVGAEDLSL